MNIKTWLLNLFTKSQKVSIDTIREYVVFDGDQTNDKTFRALFKESTTTKFVWVQVVDVVSKLIKSHLNKIEFIIPSSIGKEATDTQIAISIVDALHKIPTIERVYIVSSDGDFIDTVLNISKIFPDKKYILVDNQSRPSSKAAKIAGRTLNTTNPNCSIVKLKIKK